MDEKIMKKYFITPRDKICETTLDTVRREPGRLSILGEIDFDSSEEGIYKKSIVLGIIFGIIGSIIGRLILRKIK